MVRYLSIHSMEMTIGLASGVNDQDRFNRLIDVVRNHHV